MLNPSKALKLCREALNLLKEEGDRLPVSRQSTTMHSRSASATVMSRAQKSLHLWRWMRNVCGMELTAVSCHRWRSWHAGRNHTVSHFKRRNGLLRVAAAVAASLQHLHTRMNGSGAERAEKGKKKERKKILNVKMVCFFLTQVTGNYSLPIMFSKFSKKCPTSQHRPIYDSHYRPPLPQERKKGKKGKRKEKEKNPQITTAQPSQRPHPRLLPRRERRLDQQHCDNHLHVASPLHRNHPPSSLLPLVRHVCRFEQLWRFPLQRRLGGRRGGLECYLGGILC